MLPKGKKKNYYINDFCEKKNEKRVLFAISFHFLDKKL